MKKNVISLILNSIIVIFTIVSVGMMLTGKYAFTGFQFFTVDSNVLMGVVSVCMVVFNILSLKRKEVVRTKWLSYLKMMSTVGVTLTFVTVFVFLLPTMHDFEGMLLGSNMFMHILTPITAFITYVFFDELLPLNKKECLFAILPCFIYSFIYMACVLSSTWEDFYGFTFGGKYYLIPLVMAVMWSFCYLFGLLFRFLCKKWGK